MLRQIHLRYQPFAMVLTGSFQQGRPKTDCSNLMFTPGGPLSKRFPDYCMRSSRRLAKPIPVHYCQTMALETHGVLDLIAVCSCLCLGYISDTRQQTTSVCEANHYRISLFIYFFFLVGGGSLICTWLAISYK